MRKSRLWLTASAGVLTIALACHLDGPMSPIVPVPIRMSRFAVPPVPQVYTLSSQAGSSVELTGNNYPYNTWITVVPNGPEFMLTAYGPAQPPTGLVGATGAAGGRNGCALNAMLMYGGVATWFGPCGGTVGTDTVLAKQQWFLQQGPMPLDYPDLDCAPHPVTCHTQQIVPTTFTVAPIPALMVPVTAVPRTVQFNSVQYQEVTFTTGANPASIFVGGRVNGMPVITTSWVYTAADGTPDGNMCSGGFPYLYCQPYLHKSGRLVVKAFIGGWEQTSTITVQCLVGGEPALDDTLNDFRIRGDLLNVLVTSNADSSPSAGWTGQDWNRELSRHESGGVIWKLAYDAGYVFIPYEDPTSDAVHYHMPDSTYAPSSAPFPGATPYATVHDHPTKEDSVAYGWHANTQLPSGAITPCSRNPDDMMADGVNPAPLCDKALEDSATWRGDGPDIAVVAHRRMPEFQITNGAFIWRLNYPQTTPPTATPFRPSGDP